MKKTKTGLHIQTRKNRIEVYTQKELAQIQTTIIQLKTKGSLTKRIKQRLENRELYIKSIIFNIQ